MYRAAQLRQQSTKYRTLIANVGSKWGVWPGCGRTAKLPVTVLLCSGLRWLSLSFSAPAKQSSVSNQIRYICHKITIATERQNRYRIQKGREDLLLQLSLKMILSSYHIVFKLFFLFVTSSPADVRNIAISMSVCMPVSEHSSKTKCMTAAGSFSSMVANL